MPITLFALQAALNNGIKSYDVSDSTGLDWSDALGSSTIFDTLIVQIFGTSCIASQNLHSGSDATVATGFTSAADTGDAAPNFKVKSYLGAPAVCPVGTSGTVGKIAFALNQAGRDAFLTHTSTTVFAGTTFPNDYASVPVHTTGASGGELFGDVFMVITVSPGIAVTAGGYLTVKGYTGVGGSDSFTYVTLQSGS
jgi:hypothetical protein